MSENRNQLEINLCGEGVTLLFGVVENENGELSKNLPSQSMKYPLLATKLSHDDGEIDNNDKICSRKVRGVKRR